MVGGYVREPYQLRMSAVQLQQVRSNRSMITCMAPAHCREIQLPAAMFITAVTQPYKASTFLATLFLGTSGLLTMMVKLGPTLHD